MNACRGRIWSSRALRFTNVGSGSAGRSSFGYCNDFDARMKRMLSSSVTNEFSEQSPNNSSETPTETQPTGSLMSIQKEIGPSLIGKSAKVKRTFGPRANAQVMLICGGEALAEHASFDPDYRRAKQWIQRHAVGPAILSPVLTTGLIGALVEASFPQSIPLAQNLKQVRPLIVGVTVSALIEVTQVESKSKDQVVEGTTEYDKRLGYEVNLDTKILRLRDDAIISEGSQTIWIPDYLSM